MDLEKSKILSVIKVAFEESGEEIKHLGINAKLLMPIMSELVANYALAGEIDLALSAAKATGKSDDFRVVLDAMKKPQSDTNLAGSFMNTLPENQIIDVLMGIGDNAGLREYAANCNDYWATKVFKLLKDKNGFMALGRKLEADYLLAKKTNTLNSKTHDMPDEVVKAYVSALNLGHTEASMALISFADQLKALNGVNKKYVYSGIFDDIEYDSPLLIAYEKAGTAQGWRKAAEMYLEQIENTTDEMRALKNLKNAGDLFVKIEDFQAALQVANRLAQIGDISSTIKLIKSTGKKIDAKTLGKIHNISTLASSIAVHKAIIEYLNDHDCEIPFPTSWPDKDTERLMLNYLLRVEKLSAQVNLYRAFVGGKFIPLAKSLYCSDKKEVIAHIHSALHWHLLVGYMLSAITFEIKNGIYRNRRYSHPIYEAWLTFEEAFQRRTNDPFSKNVGSKLKELEENEVVSKLFEYCKSIIEEWKKLYNNWENTRQAEEFIASKLHNIHERFMADYKEIAQEIRDQLALL
jgi:hypothetical protein